tara:strand:- start:864 stop:1865 length:1002 start_codon:yes stop_codon:yes gene_type:complete
MTFAVAILNFNGSVLLKKFIPDIIKYCKNSNIYIIDNSSTDSSIDYISNSYPQIKVIKLKSNMGYAKGYNEGVKMIEEDVIFFLNNDAVFLDHYSYEEICKAFKTNKLISIAQPRILDYNNKNLYEYAGASGGYIDFFGYPFCRGRILNKLEDANKYKTTREIFWASGSCFVIRKNIFNLLGGFDEDFFCHMEEIDLCWRLKNIDLNYKIITIGKSKVYHMGGGTMNYGSSNKNYLNFRNSFMMMIKNLPTRYFVLSLSLRAFSDFFILIFSLITFNFKLSIPIISAYYYNLINLRKNLNKRKSSKISYKYFYVFSILINYYFFRKKIFSSLK